MQPVSMRRRLIYLALSTIAFMLTVPVAVFYATGYRFEDFNLVETGGIYVAVSASDAAVSVNGIEEGTTNLFTRSFYIDNLKQDSYSVQVTREGYFPWVKRLTVEPSIVTDIFAFLVPQNLTIREILIEDSSIEEVASTTRVVSEDQFDSFLDVFVATSTVSQPSVSTATSTPLPVATRAGVELYIENGNLIARWSRSERTIPSSFCEVPSRCVSEFYIERGKDTVRYAQFFMGGVAYATREGGVFIAESDIRPTPLVIPLYSRPGAEFRIINGQLIVKDGKSLYEITGF